MTDTQESPYDPDATPLLHAAWTLGFEEAYSAINPELGDLEDLRAFQAHIFDRYPGIARGWFGDE